MFKNWKPILICFLISLLMISGAFLCMKFKESSIHIQIGIPLEFDEYGYPITSYYKEIEGYHNTKILLLAMVNALPLQEEDYPQSNSDALIMVRYGAVGYPYQVWFTENSVIFGNRGPDAAFFKEFHNDHTEVIPLLKNIVNSIKNSQNFS